MMTGRVDDYGRALLPITIRHPAAGVQLDLEAWIDTAFTGDLLVSKTHVAALNLPSSGAVPGTVADGSEVLFDTFTCLLDWFGKRRRLRAATSIGPFALIGVNLLEDCTLLVDYPRRAVTLSLNP